MIKEGRTTAVGESADEGGDGRKRERGRGRGMNLIEDRGGEESRP